MHFIYQSGFHITECLGENEKVMKVRQMLKELKEDKMQKKLDPKKILDYRVHWRPEQGTSGLGLQCLALLSLKRLVGWSV